MVIPLLQVTIRTKTTCCRSRDSHQSSHDLGVPQAAGALVYLFPFLFTVAGKRGETGPLDPMGEIQNSYS